MFEADLRASELRKNGVRVNIQDLPFRTLRLLLSRPNEIVTREEFDKIFGRKTSSSILTGGSAAPSSACGMPSGTPLTIPFLLRPPTAAATAGLHPRIFPRPHLWYQSVDLCRFSLISIVRQFPLGIYL